MRKVTSTISYILFAVISMAQVPVSKEPRHHVVFENERVRLLNVLLPPGDTTQYHLHSTPSVFITFTKTHTASQLIHKQFVEGNSNPGDIWFENLNPPHTKIHRVCNLDTSTYHVMDVELLYKDSGFTTHPLTAEHLKLIIDTPWVRTYTIKLDKNDRIGIKDQKSGFILVAINDAMIEMTNNGSVSRPIVKAGKFYLMKPGDSITLLNLDTAFANFALVEIK